MRIKIIILVLAPFYCFSRNYCDKLLLSTDTLIQLRSNEQYVCLAQINDNIFLKAKCPCASDFKKGTKCYLVPIKIKEVLFRGDTSVFYENELNKASYLSIRISDYSNLIKNKQLIVSLSNSGGKNYLVYRKQYFYDIKTKPNFFYKDGIFVGLNPCFKASLKQRFLFCFKKNYKLTFVKKQLIPDKFDDYIVHQRNNLFY